MITHLQFKDILVGVVGSTCYGTSVDGQDDRDEMGICLEPPEYVLGLQHFEHRITRTQAEGVRSGPGDLDRVIYSLRKFCRLARQGNPSVLMLLWLPNYIVKTDTGAALLSIRGAFYSRSAGERFLGYLLSQRRRLTGERGKTVNRPELVAKYGFDTKFAMHALRLGFQGETYLRDGRIELPIPKPALTMLQEVRCGKIPLVVVLAEIDEQANRLRRLIDRCHVDADSAVIDRFLIQYQMEYWNLERY